MGKKSGSQTVSNDPWGPSQASLKFALNEAARIYGGGPGAQTSSPFRPAMQPSPMGFLGGSGGSYSTGMSGTGGFQQGYQQPSFMGQQPQQTTQEPFDRSQVSGYNLWAPAEDEMMKTISGDYLDGSNPYLDAVIARARAGVNSNFAGMSRYGSGSHIDQVMTQAEAPIRYQDYSNERGRQERAIGNLPAFQQGFANAPYADLNAFMNVVNPIAGRGSQQSQPLHSNPLAGAAGGLLGGASLGSMMAAPGATGLAAVGGWPFLLGGALLGGFAS